MEVLIRPMSVIPAKAGIPVHDPPAGDPGFRRDDRLERNLKAITSSRLECEIERKGM